jgi:hypothetical protein
MRDHSNTRDKVTEPILDWLNTADDEDQLDVIVQLKDPHALERRSNGGSARGAESVVQRKQRKQQHAQETTEDLVEFIRRLEGEGANVRYEGTLWLMPSVLVAASPPIIEMLSERSDVERIHPNYPIEMYSN